MFLPDYSLPLRPSIPGHLALNSFSSDSRRALLAQLPPNEQEDFPTAEIFETRRISALTSNPFLRTVFDQVKWDKALETLVSCGFSPLDLYHKGLKGLQDLLD